MNPSAEKSPTVPAAAAGAPESIARGLFEVVTPRGGTGPTRVRGASGGFLRQKELGYRPQPEDPIVPASVARAAGLRGGEEVEGVLFGAGSGGRPRLGSVGELAEITRVNGMTPKEYRGLTRFDDLETTSHEGTLRLFGNAEGPFALRVIDLLAPIGLGHNAIVVAPRRSGKTILVQQVVRALAERAPSLETVVLLIGERPEDAVEIERSTAASVLSSGSDESTASHVRLAELVFQSAQRRVELGKDVVIVVDSLSALARAYNAELRERGRVVVGPFDARALDRAIELFSTSRAAARGSLTVIGTLRAPDAPTSVEGGDGSPSVVLGQEIDAAILDGFSPVAVTKIYLSSELAAERVWPAIDLLRSTCRREEDFLPDPFVDAAVKLRSALHGGSASKRAEPQSSRSLVKATKAIYAKLRAHDTLEEIVESVLESA